MERAWKIGALVLVLGIVAVMLGGCLKLDMSLSVSTDNTVSGTIIFAFDKELLEASGQSIDDLMAGDSGLPEDVKGVKTAPYEDAEFTGMKLTLSAVPLSELNKDTDPDTLSIVRKGDQFVVTGTFDMSSAAAEPTGDPAMDQKTQEALDSAEIKIAITFPGEIVSSNGQVSGNTVTWEPKMGGKTTLQATANAKPGGLDLALILIIVAVVIVIVVILILVLMMVGKRKKGAADAPAAGEESAAGEVPAAPEAPTSGEGPPAT